MGAIKKTRGHMEVQFGESIHKPNLKTTNKTSRGKITGQGNQRVKLAGGGPKILIFFGGKGPQNKRCERLIKIFKGYGWRGGRG